jgi:hypothetical protein
VRSESRRILSNGLYYSSGIVSATISHDWNLRDFPFDEQELRILIETSSTASELVIVPNESKSAISDFANVQGYRLKFLHLQSIPESYETDFGITEDSGNEFSRLTISVGLARESGRLVITLLIGFIVANIFSLLTYTIHGSNLAIRVAMCGGAIFAAVGNMYSLNSAFNPAAGSLLIDRFSVGSFAAIVAALSTTILIDHYYRRNKTRQARRIDCAAPFRPGGPMGAATARRIATMPLFSGNSADCVLCQRPTHCRRYRLTISGGRFQIDGEFPATGYRSWDILSRACINGPKYF